MKIEDRLARLINAAGVELVETGKLGTHLNAVYHPSGRIFVRWGLDPVTRRCAIAHELGHAHYGHDCSTPDAERLADEWAALNLISVDDIEIAAELYEGEPAAIAAEVGIAPNLLRVWMRLHEAGRIKQGWRCPDYLEVETLMISQ